MILNVLKMTKGSWPKIIVDGNSQFFPRLHVPVKKKLSAYWIPHRQVFRDVINKGYVPEWLDQTICLLLKSMHWPGLSSETDRRPQFASYVKHEHTAGNLPPFLLEYPQHRRQMGREITLPWLDTHPGSFLPSSLQECQDFRSNTDTSSLNRSTSPLMTSCRRRSRVASTTSPWPSAPPVTGRAPCPGCLETMTVMTDTDSIGTVRSYLTQRWINVKCFARVDQPQLWQSAPNDRVCTNSLPTNEVL